MIIEELITVLGFRQSGTAALESYKRGIHSVNGAINGLIVTATRAAAILGGLGVSIGGIALVKGVVDAGRQFEKFRAILETVEGSSEKAQQSLDWVTDFAKRTPYDLAQVTAAFVRMRAYGLDPTDGSFEAIGNAGAAMGKNIMDGVEAIADATTMSFERLKEFGIVTRQEGDKVIFNWTKNGEAFSKTVQKQGTEINKALTEIFGMYAGAMDKQSKTLDGILANIGDNWDGFKRKIADAGFFNEVKRRFQGVLDTFARLEADGSLDRWAQNISDALVGAMRFAERIGATLAWSFQKAGQAVAFLTDRIERLTGMSWTTLLGAGGFAVLVRRHPVVAFVMALIAILDDLRVYMSGEGNSVIGTIMAKFEEFAETFPGLASAITEVGGALFYLVGAIVAFRLAVTGIKAAGAALAGVFSFMGGGAAGAAAGGAGLGAAAAGGGAAGVASMGWGARAAAALGVAGRVSGWITAALIAWRARAGLAASIEEAMKGNIFGGLGSGGQGGFVDRFLYSIGEAAVGVARDTMIGIFGSGNAEGPIDRNAPGGGPRPAPPSVGGPGGSMEWVPGIGYVVRPQGGAWPPQELTTAARDQAAAGMTLITTVQVYGQRMAQAMAASIGPALQSILSSAAGPLSMLGGALGITAQAAPAPVVNRTVTVTVSAPVSITMTGTAATPGAVGAATSSAITGAASRAADILASEPAADASPALGAQGASS